MRKIEQIVASAIDFERLDWLVRDRNTPQKVVWRARIVLSAGDSLTRGGDCGGGEQERAYGPPLASLLYGKRRGRIARARSVLMESKPDSSFLIEHDLFRKPVSTFRDHALKDATRPSHVKPLTPERINQLFPRWLDRQIRSHRILESISDSDVQ